VIQGTFGVIQGTFGVIQGTFGVIQGTFGAIQGTFSAIQRTFDLCVHIGSDRPFKDPFSWRTPPEYLSSKFPFLFRTLSMV
jgi:hypothetical protein